MKGWRRCRVVGWSVGAALLMVAVFVTCVALADRGGVGFTATLYSDVIRFEADGVGSLRLTIYDLSENELWSSGQVMGDFVDWDRANASGERLANGYYLYLAQGWDGSDTLVLNKTGKVVLLPGDQVQLKASPATGGTDSASDGDSDWPGDPVQPGPRAHTPGTSTFDKVGVGTLTPTYTFDVNGVFRATNASDSITYIRTTGTNNSARIDIAAGNGTTSLRYAYFRFSSFETVGHDWRAGMYGNKSFTIYDATSAAARFVIDTAGRVGIGTTSPGYKLDVAGGFRALASTDSLCAIGTTGSSNSARLDISSGNGTTSLRYAYTRFTSLETSGQDWAAGMYGDKNYTIYDRTNGAARVVVSPTGTVGIGTTNAPDKLTIEGSSGNLIACYPGTSRAAGAAVFRVEYDGDVYADGTVYSAAWAVGSADVAERINMSEWVEAGDVVEIDPEHVGFFRKASGVYSRRVAGIISTSPGVILGNDVDPVSGEWNDNRPVLAIAGRVPVKVSTENGPIAVGDLLVSSSVAGVAMKGDPEVSIGAVVGKAMEPLESGEAVIMTQVTLR